MRILILNWKDIAHPAVGGAEVYIHEVARCWVEAGHEVTIFSTASAEAASFHETRIDGINLVRSGRRVSVYRRARKWYGRTGAGQFDVVLDTVNTRPFLSPLWVTDTPLVALIFQVAREVWFQEVPLPLAAAGRYWLEPRWLRPYRDVPVLTISESSRGSLADYGLNNISVVPVGWSEPDFHADVPRESRPTLVFVGRLAANKRPADAIRAFVEVRRSIPDAEMWVVGTGPKERELRRKWERNGVTFFGRVTEEEKFNLLARAHLLVVTSVREGWGLVVNEAAAVGTAAVGYDVPGLRDSIRSANGVLVKPDVGALAETLVALLSDGMYPTPEKPSASEGVAGWDDVAGAILCHLQRAVAPAQL